MVTMTEIELITTNHLSTPRDYLARVNDREFPKYLAATLAKEWGFDYWDGDRRINYGGYFYKKGYWEPVARNLIKKYKLTSDSRILDIGCGKGFLLYEISLLCPGIKLKGLDISQYAIANAKDEVFADLVVGNATQLPFKDKEFDLAFSVNTFHNLYNFELNMALKEISRVSHEQFICVESYRNETEKANLLYWQVTCEAFNTPEEWRWWFNLCRYSGDYEFIYFQ
jgi:SAM-dependent methyltransferase